MFQTHVVHIQCEGSRRTHPHLPQLASHLFLAFTKQTNTAFTYISICLPHLALLLGLLDPWRWMHYLLQDVRHTNPVIFCHTLNTQSTATSHTCTAPSSNCITSQTLFSLPRAFSPCSSTSSHNLISFARLWYTLFVAETSVELKGTHKVKWQLTILHWQGTLAHSHTHTHLCSLRTYVLSTPWIVVTVSRTIVPLPGNISSFLFITTSWKCFRANCTCSSKSSSYFIKTQHTFCNLVSQPVPLHVHTFLTQVVTLKEVLCESLSLIVYMYWYVHSCMNMQVFECTSTQCPTMNIPEIKSNKFARICNDKTGFDKNTSIRWRKQFYMVLTMV